MKRILLLPIVLCWASLTAARAQITAHAYSITERGPHHQVLEAPAARPGAPPHRIVEIATGIHHLDETDTTGKIWKRTEAIFEATDSGFIAPRRQHQIQLASDLNVKRAMMPRTSGGADIQATPVAVALFDTASGIFQVIGVITNCTGVLIASTQALYGPRS